MTQVSRMIRALAYLWAAPTTLLGLPLLILALLTGGRARVVQGAIEAHGPGAALVLKRLTPLKGGASAITLGHIIIGRDAQALERSRRHEHVHVAQCERWGPLFIPAYLLASLVACRRGGHFYRDNIFEREAFGACD